MTVKNANNWSSFPVIFSWFYPIDGFCLHVPERSRTKPDGHGADETEDGAEAVTKFWVQSANFGSQGSSALLFVS
jgi:hypothetical protein